LIADPEAGNEKHLHGVQGSRAIAENRQAEAGTE